MFAFLKRLFGRSSQPAPRRSPRSASPRAGRARSASPASEPAAPLPGRDKPREAAAGGLSPAAELLALLDGKAHFQHALTGREETILSAVARRADEGDLALPHLPATSLAAMEMAAKPSANISDVVELISTDPVLSSELLKVSNSALYAGREKCETLQAAVVRMGLRALRSMILSISMRQVMMRDKALAHVAQEIWRQSHSVSQMARAIAPLLGMDRDRAFLIALLHDIGKVALLETVRQEARDFEVRPALLGRAFYLHHERAGERLARAWKLPDEIVSVAGCHHRFDRNEVFPRSAALASLAHSLDLAMTLGQDQGDAHLLSLPELDALGIEEVAREEILSKARETFEAARAPAAAA